MKKNNLQSGDSQLMKEAFSMKMDKPNFRKKILNSGLVVPLGEYQPRVGTTGRPAELYALKRIPKKAIKDRIHFNFTLEDPTS